MLTTGSLPEGRKSRRYQMNFCTKSKFRGFALAVGYVAGAMLLMDSAALAAKKKPVSVFNGSIAGGGVVTVKVSKAGSTRSNKSGFFSLKGPKLAGTHTVTFTQNHQKFTTSINVPSGSKLTLSGVKLSGDTATGEEEDISVEGTLSAVDCVASPNTLTVTPSKGGADVLMNFDPATATIIDDSTGTAITSCSTLSASYIGAPVDAEGTTDTSGAITASRVELNPSTDGEGEGSGSGGSSEDISFKGTVSSESCPTSIVVTRTDGTLVTVNISTSTKIDIEGFSGSSPAQCSDIPASASVEVEGVPQTDGSVNADSIHVQQNEFESDGTIGTIDCSATPPSFSFTPDSGTALTVTIQPTTKIEANDNDSASCSDLTAAGAKVEGITQPDGSVAAKEIEQ